MPANNRSHHAWGGVQCQLDCINSGELPMLKREIAGTNADTCTDTGTDTGAGNGAADTIMVLTPAELHIITSSKKAGEHTLVDRC